MQETKHNFWKSIIIDNEVLAAILFFWFLPISFPAYLSISMPNIKESVNICDLYYEDKKVYGRGVITYREYNKIIRLCMYISMYKMYMYLLINDQIYT
jgi:hypothetical protein